MPPGASEHRHYHERARQFFFILRGEATMELGGKLVTLREREGVEVAPGVAHTMMNRSAADVEFLVVSAPKAHGDRIADPPRSPVSMPPRVRSARPNPDGQSPRSAR